MYWATVPLRLLIAELSADSLGPEACDLISAELPHGVTLGIRTNYRAATLCLQSRDTLSVTVAGLARVFSPGCPDRSLSGLVVVKHGGQAPARQSAWELDCHVHFDHERAGQRLFCACPLMSGLPRWSPLDRARSGHGVGRDSDGYSSPRNAASYWHTTARATGGQMSQGWQYQVTECDDRLGLLQTEVAKCATDGWELVSTCPKNRAYGRTVKVLLFWRRPTA